MHAKAKQSKELGAEPESDWLLDFANYLDKAYESVGTSVSRAGDKASEFQLAYANSLENVYNTVSKEVANVGDKSTKAVGTGFQNLLPGGASGPYMIGGIVALIAAYYVSQIAFKRS